MFAYELLSRDSELNRAAFIDGDKATAQLLLNTFLEIGLDQVVGPQLAFVNVTRNFILSEYCTSLPKDRVVFEIAEDTLVDGALLDKLSLLMKAGYSIALDNFEFTDRWRPLLEVCDIVKLDVQRLGRDAIQHNVAALREYDIKLLAQKVESHEDYRFCKDLGFDYYQGYFFCKPQILSGHTIPFNRLSTLNLLSRLQDPSIGISELEHAVGQDVAISYRILRYLNSPIHALNRKVESLRHAITLVGTRLICNWASMILLEAVEEKPRELMVISMIRAHMCQQLGTAMRQKNLDQFFTVGLFSLIGALVDVPTEEALKGLPLVDEVKDALLHRKGIMARALECVEAYERCDWDHTECEGLEEKHIRDAFLRSVSLTRAATHELVN